MRRNPNTISSVGDLEQRSYWIAHCENAFMRRAEGSTFEEIGDYIGVTSSGARSRVYRMGRRLARAMRKTVFTLGT
jgi:hypothetical protein